MERQNPECYDNLDPWLFYSLVAINRNVGVCVFITWFLVQQHNSGIPEEALREVMRGVCDQRRLPKTL